MPGAEPEQHGRHRGQPTVQDGTSGHQGRHQHQRAVGEGRHPAGQQPGAGLRSAWRSLPPGDAVPVDDEAWPVPDQVPGQRRRAVEQPDHRDTERREDREAEQAGQRRHPLPGHDEPADREDRGDREDQPERAGHRPAPSDVPDQQQEAERAQHGPAGPYGQPEALLRGVPPVEQLDHDGGRRRRRQQDGEHPDGGRPPDLGLGGRPHGVRCCPRRASFTPTAAAARRRGGRAARPARPRARRAACRRTSRTTR